MPECWLHGSHHRRQKRIIIFADNDATYAGQAAAYALARRLGSRNRSVDVQFPTEVGADWSDVHQLQLNRGEIQGKPGHVRNGAVI